MLCDLHCHSSGISTCCRISYEQVIDEALNAGYNGIVLTNHYVKDYLKGISVENFIDKYVEEYLLTEKYGKSVGLKVFFGVEVTMEFDKRVHLLIYGITFQQLKENPYLFDMSLEELYSFCELNGLSLVQAHPYRNGANVLRTDCLDGVEINCHPKYGNAYSKELIEIAKKNGLSVTCGCDYHGDTAYRPKGGLFLPEYVKTDVDLAKYLKNSTEFRLQIHEVGSPEFYKKIEKIKK